MATSRTARKPVRKATKASRKTPKRTSRKTRTTRVPEPMPFANPFHYLDAWFGLLGPSREEGET